MPKTSWTDSGQPDSVIARRFENGSEGVELIVVAGHKKRTVHTPGYCMPGDDWEVLTQVPHTMKVAGRPVPAMRSLMVKEHDRLLVTYFFTDGAYSTNNLLRFQGHQLVKRVRRVLPIGALVRMTGATVLPIYFHGRNRMRFNVMNAVSRDLGLTFMLGENTTTRWARLSAP